MNESTSDTTGLTLAPSANPPEQPTANCPSVPPRPEPTQAETVTFTVSLTPILVTGTIGVAAIAGGWYYTMIVLSQGPDGVKAMRAMGDATSKVVAALAPLPIWLASLKR